MAIPVLMPALSPTMEEGKLAKWLVKEGDKVSSGDVIAEIETDKATMEVEAVDEGIIGKILILGDTEGVKVNTPIALILEEGESAASLDAFSVKVPTLAVNQNTAPEDNISNAPAAPQQPTPQKQDGQRVFASPLAKRIAEQNNVVLANVTGTGPYGRIVKHDVENAMKSGVAPKTAAAQTQAVPTVPGVSNDTIRAMYNADDYEVLPVDGMRKTVAKRLLESKVTVPHFYLSCDVELDALLKLRSQVNARSDKEGPNAFKISVNDFVIKAMALALQKVPNANVTWTDNGILRHKYSDVAVAVAIEGGLFTPVIRRAESKSMITLSSEMKDLAKRARARKLKPEEYQGGTTAVSNLGMFGVKDFAAIINPPHASIIAVGAGEQRAVVKDGALAIANVMTVTLSIDHRAVDGALGAELLQAFKGFIEDPMSMLL